MGTFDASRAAWVKSSYSNSGGGNCIEWAPSCAFVVVPVRDSKDPQGPVLLFAPAAWSAFVAAVAGGELSAEGAFGGRV